MRIAIVGYGAVAAIHARELAHGSDAELAVVCGPDAKKAEAFALEHGIKRTVTSVDDIVGVADAAIVCSPSGLHFEQARALLQAGVSTLVELPACSSLHEALELGRLAEERGLILQCAHTSRYVEPSRRLGEALSRGTLGSVLQIHSMRTLTLRKRSWSDDALLHHAAHPLHLLLHWFPSLRLIGCAAQPAAIGAQDVAVLAALDHGAPATISISYSSHLPKSEMIVIGDRHTFSTDGFSRVRSDLSELDWDGDAEEAYHTSIRNQDLDFLRACRGEKAGTPWDETITLMRTIDELRQLARQTG